MKIIDNKKDYYDYLQGIMGIDEKVTYDRRGSTVVGPSEYYVFNYPYGFDLFFSKKPFTCDKPKTKKTLWDSAKHDFKNSRFNIGWKRGHKEQIEEGDIHYLFLEVGYHQFIFEVERYLDEDGKTWIPVSGIPVTSSSNVRQVETVAWRSPVSKPSVRGTGWCSPFHNTATESSSLHAAMFCSSPSIASTFTR